MVLDVDAEIQGTAEADAYGAFDDQVEATSAADQIAVANALSVEARVVSIEVGGQTTSVDVTVPPGETLTLPVTLSELAPPPAPEPAEGEDAPPPAPPLPVKVHLAARRRTDIIAPRAHAIVRHAGVRHE